MTTTLTPGKTLVELAEELKLNFFLVSYTDILGGNRAKLVHAAKIASVKSNGAFFAPFASHFGLGADAHDIAAAPRMIFKNVLKRCEDLGYSYKTGVEAKFFLLKQNVPRLPDRRCDGYCRASLLRSNEFDAAV